MLLEIDTRSETPIYQQLCDQIILGIARQELAIGEMLPTVRQLADELGVNTMTISKAYNLLKDAGYLVTDRRKGSIVTQPPPFKESGRQDWEQRLALLLAEAKVRQLPKIELETTVAAIWQTFEKEAEAPLSEQSD